MTGEYSQMVSPEIHLCHHHWCILHLQLVFPQRSAATSNCRVGAFYFLEWDLHCVPVMVLETAANDKISPYFKEKTSRLYKIFQTIQPTVLFGEPL